MRAHHASPTSAALAASLQRVDFKIFTLVCRLLAGAAPVYLANKCPLVTTAGRCPLLIVEHAWPRHHVTSSMTAVLPLPGQCCGIVCLNSFGNTLHHLRTIQTIVENVYVWLVGPQHPVSER